MDPREYMARQNAETRKIESTVRRAVRRSGAPATAAQREDLAAQLLPQVRRARVRMHDAGADLFRSEAARVRVDAPGVPDAADYQPRALVRVMERVTGAGETAAGERRRVTVSAVDPQSRRTARVRVTVTEDNREDPAVVTAVADRAAAAVARHVRNAGREAVEHAAEAAGSEIGWARVLTGAESCAFCSMLASRGPVYGSRESAEFITARSGRFDVNEQKAFHDWCDCIVVPVFEGQEWFGQEHYEQLEDLWVESTRGLSAPDSTKAFEKALKQTNLNRVPDSESDTGDDESPRTVAPRTPNPAPSPGGPAPVVEPPAVPTSTRTLVARARETLPDSWSRVDATTRDRNGAIVPSDELLGHLDAVIEVGAALQRDIARVLDSNDELRELRKVRDAAQDAEAKARERGEGFGVTAPLQVRREKATQQIAPIERDAIVAALRDVREFGGHQQNVVIGDLAGAPERSGVDLTAGDDASREMLRYAEQYYPTDWLRRADARGPLTLGYAKRAFLWSVDTDGDFIAGEPLGARAPMGTSHGDMSREVMIHELGHRMEKAVPGLTQLQFALARRRAMTGGVLDPLVELFRPGSGEYAYEDRWRNAYAGRTYATVFTTRPELTPHEVFQVGTQDLFGRGVSRYGDDELEAFMLGVLTLL